MSCVTMNSIRASPTPSAGSCHQRSAASGFAEVQQHVRARLRHGGEIEVLDRVLGDAVVDRTDVALGAGHRDALPVAQHARRVAGADDRGQPELAAHDRGVRRAAAVVGHDRGGAFHDRHPVGVRDLGDEDRARR